MHATTLRRAVPETVSIYQVFIRNFTEEGSFRAAENRLDSVKELGFDWVYLTPVHPIGKAARKGSVGSPYAVADYRKVDEASGGLAGFDSFIAAARARGLKVMIDVVYNHTAPDSRLAAEKPEWFLRGKGGKPGRKCEEWSDVVDLDFSSGGGLREELISTLEYWRDRGVEGFRCDVASLVPVDFWIEARRRVNRAQDGEEASPVLWLAESVHPSFLLSMRERGFGAWSDAELHAAFDLTYDYDGWERLEKAWSGELPLARYLEYLEVQNAAYPAGARKIRYLENHDQERAAARFGRGSRLRAWTAFYQFLPGIAFAYMGQENAVDRRPSLFERDPVPWKDGDSAFRAFFKACLAATAKAKAEAPAFSWTVPAEGVIRMERKGRDADYTLLANLDDRSGKVDVGAGMEGVDLLSGKDISLTGRIELPRGAILVRKPRGGAAAL